jgi:hypothetical protein
MNDKSIVPLLLCPLPSNEGKGLRQKILFPLVFSDVRRAQQDLIALLINALEVVPVEKRLQRLPGL